MQDEGDFLAEIFSFISRATEVKSSVQSRDDDCIVPIVKLWTRNETMLNNLWIIFESHFYLVESFCRTVTMDDGRWTMDEWQTHGRQATQVFITVEWFGRAIDTTPYAVHNGTIIKWIQFN